MSLDLDQLRAGMQAGSQGKWVVDCEDEGAEWGQSFRVCTVGDWLHDVAEMVCNETDAHRIARVPDLEARVLYDAARIAAADAAMALVERAANHLQKNGMNPGWGTAKDDLNAALAIYRATAPASPTSEGDET